MIKEFLKKRINNSKSSMIVIDIRDFEITQHYGVGEVEVKHKTDYMVHVEKRFKPENPERPNAMDRRALLDLAIIMHIKNINKIKSDKIKKGKNEAKL